MKTKKNCRHYSTQRRGQTLVETAMVLLTVLIPLTIGIFQFGIYLNAVNTLTQLARDGARYAAVGRSDGEIKDYIQAATAGTSIRAADLPDSAIVISMAVNPNSTATPKAAFPRVSGNPIQVRITYPMSRKIFVGNFLPAIVRLRDNYVAQSTFVLE